MLALVAAFAAYFALLFFIHSMHSDLSRPEPLDPPARAGGWLPGTQSVYAIVVPSQIAATWRALPAVAGGVFRVPSA